MVTHHDEIVAKALEDIPLLHAFKARFPESQHFISYITGEDGRTTWNSVTPLFGRYVFSMTIPITIDSSTFRVRLDAEPNFELREITVITPLSDGRQQISYGNNIIFDTDMEGKMQASNWNFEELGINLKKDQPVKGFSTYSAY